MLVGDFPGAHLSGEQQPHERPDSGDDGGNGEHGLHYPLIVRKGREIEPWG